MIGAFFAFCQVVGTMCALPDLPSSEETPRLAADVAPTACPMDRTMMCPPSAASSPERHVNHGLTLKIDHAPIPVDLAAVLLHVSPTTLWHRSSAFSIVPVSIGSSSVLRI
jgi:hypothetical protein